MFGINEYFNINTLTFYSKILDHREHLLWMSMYTSWKSLISGVYGIDSSLLKGRSSTNDCFHNYFGFWSSLHDGVNPVDFLNFVELLGIYLLVTFGLSIVCMYVKHASWFNQSWLCLNLQLLPVRSPVTIHSFTHYAAMTSQNSGKKRRPPHKGAVFLPWDISERNRCCHPKICFFGIRIIWS